MYQNTRFAVFSQGRSTVLSAALLLGFAMAGCSGGGSQTIQDNVNQDAAPSTATDAAEEFENCGDTFITGNEQCDDGNDSEDDLCKNDCTLACGDGVVNSVENCDTGISDGMTGACHSVETCTPSNACETVVFSGDGCQARCLTIAIEVNSNDDGCCLPGADSTVDNDCANICGNGILETGELCDTGIATGPGACVATCDDSVVCSEISLVDGNTCQARCEATPITAPANNDGCCPDGADIGNDNDCSFVCGDGVVTAPNETCDTAIPNGDGTCPVAADCVTEDACLSDELSNAGTCQAVCNPTPVTTVGLPDGCCPPAGNNNTDVDCAPICGNGVIEAGETCDDDNTDSGDGCDNTCQQETAPTAFRVNSVSMRDPHAFAKVSFLCPDITGQLNDEFTAAVTEGDPLRLNLLTVFQPHAPASPKTGMEIAFPQCSAPIETTVCTGSPNDPASVPSTAFNKTTGTCLAVEAGTTSGYNPAVNNSTGPCFASDKETLLLDVGGLLIPLSNAQVGGTYVGDTEIVNGLIKGFISEATANEIVLPEDLPVVGGDPLSSVLRGGAGNCKSGDDRDTLDGVSGWWLYLNFTSAEVPYTP